MPAKFTASRSATLGMATLRRNHALSSRATPNRVSGHLVYCDDFQRRLQAFVFRLLQVIIKTITLRRSVKLCARIFTPAAFPSFTHLPSSRSKPWICKGFLKRWTAAVSETVSIAERQNYSPLMAKTSLDGLVHFAKVFKAISTIRESSLRVAPVDA
jgi:hypothetical protein